MLILLVSDTHRNYNKLQTIIDANPNADYIIHLGDIGVDMDKVYVSSKASVHYVQGNCDDNHNKCKLHLTIEGVKIYATHGDDFSVKMGRKELVSHIKNYGINLCFYGHTHIQEKEIIDGITLVNPGYSSDGEYALVNIENGSFDIEFKKV